MEDLKVKVDELLSKSDEVIAIDKTIGENIELCREYLKEIDNLLANIAVYNGEVE